MALQHTHRLAAGTSLSHVYAIINRLNGFGRGLVYRLTRPLHILAPQKHTHSHTSESIILRRSVRSPRSRRASRYRPSTKALPTMGPMMGTYL